MHMWPLIRRINLSASVALSAGLGRPPLPRLRSFSVSRRGLDAALLFCLRSKTARDDSAVFTDDFVCAETMPASLLTRRGQQNLVFVGSVQPRTELLSPGLDLSPPRGCESTDGVGTTVPTVVVDFRLFTETWPGRLRGRGVPDTSLDGEPWGGCRCSDKVCMT